MAKVKTRLVSFGKHQSPEGEVEVTPSRVDHWVQQFNSMKSQGMDFPVPWGHTKYATPENRAFLQSRFNAGYIASLSRGDDGLYGEFDVPGLELDGNKLVSVATLPNGLPVRTAIKEVSVGIKKAITDGKGKPWNDVIAHAALVTHPVVAGQDGFQGLGRAYDDIVEVVNESPGWNLALDMKSKKPKKSDKRPMPGNEPDDEAGEDEPEDGDEGYQESKDDGDEGSHSYSFDDLLGNLTEIGAALPPDTNEKNICERLWVATTALLASRNPAGRQPAQPGGRTVAEQQPDVMMMNLLRDKPELKAYFDGLKADKDKLESDNKKFVLKEKQAKLDSFKERLNKLTLPKAIQDKHFAQLTSNNLSLDDGSVNFDEIEKSLSLAEAMFTPEIQQLSQRLTDTKTLIERPAPMGADGKDSDKVADDMLRMAGVASK